MIEWGDIPIFIALSTAGTHKAAAKLLRVDQATVGRRIKEFESALGTKLFDKRSDGFVLTEAGSQLLARAKEAEALVAQIERNASALDQRPEGVIKIAMPGALANLWFIPRLKPFLRQYPKIRIEFLTGPEVINLWNRDADVAIRLVEPKQKELFYRKIGELQLRAYATKAFMTEHKQSKEVRALPFVGLFDRSMSDAERKLCEKIGPFANVVCRSHAWSSVYNTVRADIAFGILPSFIGDSDKSLVAFADLPSAKTAMWLVMHPDVRGSGRMKALSEFLADLQHK